MMQPSDILHGKILVVDDQPQNVLLLERMLRGAGYDAVSSTMDPTKVSELHLLNHYDLILLDLQMPGMNGFQVMENLKQIENGSSVPVLVITAQAEHKLKALKAGARDFLSKPLDLAEVLLRVHNLLEVRLLQLQTRALYERVLAEQVASARLLQKSPPAAQPTPTPGAFTGTITESYAELTVLFRDLVDFTTFAQGASATVLQGVLENLSGELNGAGRHRERTIGDAYLASVGQPDALVDHTIRAANLAVDLVEAVDRLNAHSGCRLKLRLSLARPGSA